jgi:hypothetical protein
MNGICHGLTQAAYNINDILNERSTRIAIRSVPVSVRVGGRSRPYNCLASIRLTWIKALREVTVEPALRTQI